MGLELIEKQVVYPGKKVRFEIHHLQDDDGNPHLREICVHNGAVVVLAWLNDQSILVIRNRRYSIGQVLLELPAGTLEKNEDPINCAGRELLEETGYLATRIVPITNFFTSPGVLTEKMYAFAAYDLERRSQALEAGEEIEVSPMRFDDAVEMCRTGQIVDGKTIATLLYFERFCRQPDGRAAMSAGDQ
jgi:ADP-ribose pyrophosphatase